MLLADEERRARQDRITRIMLYITLMYLVFFRSAEPFDEQQERVEPFARVPTPPPPPPPRQFSVQSERERHWVELPPPFRVPPPRVRRAAPPPPQWPTSSGGVDRDALRRYAGVRRQLDAAAIAEVWQRAATMRPTGACARRVRDVFSGDCYDAMRICHDDDPEQSDCYVRVSLWPWAAALDDLRLMAPMTRACAVHFDGSSVKDHDDRPHMDLPSCVVGGNETLPLRELRGDIARALAHSAALHAKQTPKLGSNKRARLLRWHAADPVDNDERWFNELVAATQGDRNAFVDHPQLLEKFWGVTNTTSNVR